MSTAARHRHGCSPSVVAVAVAVGGPAFQGGCQTQPLHQAVYVFGETSRCDCPLLPAQAVTAALPSLKAAVPPGVRIGGYANGFQTTTSGGRQELAACSGACTVG